jgi:ACS family hexuronate transporter-like MFS transporter
MGAALNQVGITVGMMGAPLFAGFLASRFGWRSAFVATGLVGFLWVPLWLLTARRVPARTHAASSAGPSASSLVRDWRLWGLAVANILMMTVYSLWTNWTTVFLVSARGLSLEDANRQFVWIPPVFASLGGLSGGWLSMRLASGGADVYRARLKVCVVCGALLTCTVAVPWVPGAGLATALISVSFFLAVAMSSNIYAMPLDLFGARHAAFAVSVLTASYGLMQMVASPLLFGRLADRYGWGPVCVVSGLLPLASVGVLAAVGRASHGQSS